MEILKKACASLDEQEHAQTPRIEAIRPVYESLLKQFPALEGFWVRWAHTEFRLTQNSEQPLLIFERAVAKVPFSLLLWVSYLKFFTQLCVYAPDRRVKLLDRALEAVGDNFWSHELWDMRLGAAGDHSSDKAADVVPILIDILENRVLHQVTRFYVRLVAILDSASTPGDLSAFAHYLPEIIGAQPDADELAQYKEVIKSKLGLKYRLHAMKVKNAMQFERRIQRPFFYPGRQHRGDLKVWLDYAEQSEAPWLIYERALVPFYTDAKMWIQYCRALERANLNHKEAQVFELCDLPEVQERRRLLQAAPALKRSLKELVLEMIERQLAAESWLSTEL